MDQKSLQKSLSNFYQPENLVGGKRLFHYKFGFQGIAIGILVGIFSGLLLACFMWIIYQLSKISYGYFDRTLVMLFLPAIGLFFSTLVLKLFNFSEEKGLDSVLRSIHQKNGLISILLVPASIISTVFTIVFGGSAGREGPGMQISASIASWIGRLFPGRIIPLEYILIAGLSASFAALFNAPIAGAIFGAEIIYIRNIEYRALIITTFSSFSSFFIYSIIIGRESLFPMISSYSFSTVQIPIFILIGLILGGIVPIYSAIFYYMGFLRRKIRINCFVKPIIFGLVLGAFYLFYTNLFHLQIPIWGFGRQEILSATTHATQISAVVFLALFIGKTVATSLTLGAGAEGGLVLPTFYVGTMLGGFLGQLFGFDPVAMTIICGLAFFGAAAHAPLTVILLAAETTSQDFIIPVALATVVGAFVSGEYSIFREVTRRDIMKKDIAE